MLRDEAEVRIATDDPVISNGFFGISNATLILNGKPQSKMIGARPRMIGPPHVMKKKRTQPVVSVLY